MHQIFGVFCEKNLQCLLIYSNDAENKLEIHVTMQLAVIIQFFSKMLKWPTLTFQIEDTARKKLTRLKKGI